jgi:hypothetical protein
MSMTIRVYDRRPELTRARLVVEFPKTPESWDIKTVMTRYGIADHLTVERYFPGGKREIIHRGRWEIY